MNALAKRAQCKIAAANALAGAHVSTIMWAVRRLIILAELPRRRAVIRFHFRDDPPPKSPRYWFVVKPGADQPGICTFDPGRNVDLYIETRSVSLGAILEGRSSVRREKDAGRLFLSGDPGLARSTNRWLRTSAWAVEGTVPLA